MVYTDLWIFGKYKMKIKRKTSADGGTFGRESKKPNSGRLRLVCSSENITHITQHPSH